MIRLKNLVYFSRNRCFLQSNISNMESTCGRPARSRNGGGQKNTRICGISLNRLGQAIEAQSYSVTQGYFAESLARQYSDQADHIGEQ